VPLTVCHVEQANVEAANINGTTALMMSALNGHEDCLRQLLAAKVHSCTMRMTVQARSREACACGRCCSTDGLV
jgi:ankyrin repeat protein